MPLLNPKGPSTQTVVVPTVSLRPLPRVSGAHSHRLSLSCHLKLRPRRREENGCVSRKLPSAITKSSRGHKRNRKCQGNQKSGSGGRRRGRVCWCDGPRCSHLLLKRTPDTWALSWLPARLGRNANLRQAHPRPQRREETRQAQQQNAPLSATGTAASFPISASSQCCSPPHRRD